MNTLEFPLRVEEHVYLVGVEELVLVVQAKPLQLLLLSETVTKNLAVGNQDGRIWDNQEGMKVRRNSIFSQLSKQSLRILIKIWIKTNIKRIKSDYCSFYQFLARVIIRHKK